MPIVFPPIVGTVTVAIGVVIPLMTLATLDGAMVVAVDDAVRMEPARCAWTCRKEHKLYLLVNSGLRFGSYWRCFWMNSMILLGSGDGTNAMR